ncbi:MAG: UDP-N-acetylmuramoyl-L-alanyl-D-glutamate--2,6-diaminopimelate ligase [Bacteroidales bacterium]|nr:UDP-N-acetylmuramoyl-L-alanyl-D-glutamate--2,6-diaminopimelate ligase [Bacteroidales bacterium]
MKLENLIKEIMVLSVEGDTGKEIHAVTFDSREVTAGCLFVAIQGTAADGHVFIPEAAEHGAAAVVCETLPGVLSEEVTYILTDNTRRAVAMVAAEWYGHPSKEINLVGITGTNGKTTIATLLYKVNTGLGYKAGILTTIGVTIGDKAYPATHTTPDAMQINKYLREMVDSGCDYCFMEVSSHAVSQHRTDGLVFRGGVFTNLTHDHLDYHKNFRDYLEAKKTFFDQLPQNAFALTNADDRNGAVMVQNCRAGIHRYALGKVTGFHGKVLEPHFEGMRMLINDKEVWVRLTGRFNASNILAVYGVSLLLGHDEMQVLEALSNAAPVDGRFEIIKGASGTIGIIDYAHTDDALKNVLETIHEVNREGREIITVAGAGGDRDNSKRPKMGAVAISYSKKVILTSDNPRSEDPYMIMDQMEKGMPADRLGDVLKIADREEAIKTACMLAGPASVILVAGKGHEKYQETGGIKRHFDDKEVVTKYIK